MDKAAGKNSAAGDLFPRIEPFARNMLDVGDGHRIYYEQSGTPTGLPVVVLHGGPGGGCSPAMRRFFDPEKYHIILFDQRGCGRSRPHASVNANTTWHLVADIEKIREAVGVERWIVFGGSWGATLSLIYAQAHPARVAWLVLRGVFLGTKPELDWFYGGGAGQFFPELWQDFVDLIPEEERDDLIAAYHRRLFSGNHTEEATHARAWSGWENAVASIENNGARIDTPGEYARAFARLENHYFVNGVFLDAHQQILANMRRIAHIPGTIVQGRQDMICPPQTAWALHRAWPSSELRMIAKSGHALSEPGIAAALVRTMNRLARQRETLGL